MKNSTRIRSLHCLQIATCPSISYNMTKSDEKKPQILQPLSLEITFCHSKQMHNDACRCQFARVQGHDAC